LLVHAPYAQYPPQKARRLLTCGSSPRHAFLGFPLCHSNTVLTEELKRDLVPKVLGNKTCMLLELDLEEMKISGTWEATFGNEKLLCPVLRKLSLPCCKLTSCPPISTLPSLRELECARHQAVSALVSTCHIREPPAILGNHLPY
jgi:hypothetical protein